MSSMIGKEGSGDSSDSSVETIRDRFGKTLKGEEKKRVQSARLKAAIVAEQPAKMLVGVDHSHLLLAIERKKEDWVRLMLGSLPPGGKLERFGYGA